MAIMCCAPIVDPCAMCRGLEQNRLVLGDVLDHHNPEPVPHFARAMRNSRSPVWMRWAFDCDEATELASFCSKALPHPAKREINDQPRAAERSQRTTACFQTTRRKFLQPLRPPSVGAGITRLNVPRARPKSASKELNIRYGPTRLACWPITTQSSSRP